MKFFIQLDASRTLKHDVKSGSDKLPQEQHIVVDISGTRRDAYDIKS
ncbi:MAG TPA: hypothetical protein VEL70_01425 [Candidatus Acidoferrum sp.]|nr:hypothetical protein [Candidatus Acidoferrum sp.]